MEFTRRPPPAPVAFTRTVEPLPVRKKEKPPKAPARKKVQKRLSCCNCAIFRELPIQKEYDGKRWEIFRDCPITEQPRQADDPACARFEVHDFIWCVAGDQWLYNRICVARFQSNNQYCQRNCPVGKGITPLVQKKYTGFVRNK